MPKKKTGFGNTVIKDNSLKIEQEIFNVTGLEDRIIQLKMEIEALEKRKENIEQDLNKEFKVKLDNINISAQDLKEKTQAFNREKVSVLTKSDKLTKNLEDVEIYKEIIDKAQVKAIDENAKLQKAFLSKHEALDHEIARYKALIAQQHILNDTIACKEKGLILQLDTLRKDQELVNRRFVEVAKREDKLKEQVSAFKHESVLLNNRDDEQNRKAKELILKAEDLLEREAVVEKALESIKEIESSVKAKTELNNKFFSELADRSQQIEIMEKNSKLENSEATKRLRNVKEYEERVLNMTKKEINELEKEAGL